MKSVTFIIPNISCGHCVHTIKTELSDLVGIKSIEANHETKTATIVFTNPATEVSIKSLLAEINYPAAE